MGFAIMISFSYKWERVYFVQECDEQRAKEKAFNMFKGTMGCHLPETLEDANQNDGFYIETLATIEQIIL